MFVLMAAALAGAALGFAGTIQFGWLAALAAAPMAGSLCAFLAALLLARRAPARDAGALDLEALHDVMVESLNSVLIAANTQRKLEPVPAVEKTRKQS